MFVKETMTIVEIVKAAPDSKSDDDMTMKSYADLAAEAAKRGVSPYTLEVGLNHLSNQGLAAVRHSRNGAILGVMPTKMFRQLFG